MSSTTTSICLLDNQFRQLWHSFNAASGGLRLFSEQISSLADQIDEQFVDEFAQVMVDVFRDPIERVRAELREFLPSLEKDQLYPDFYNQPNVRDTFEVFRDTDFRRRVLKWGRENPQKAHHFLNAWIDYMAQPPMSGIVLRQSTLINLVSTVEIFVDGVIRIHLEQFAAQRTPKEHPTWKERWETLQEIAPSHLWQAYREPLREIIARRNALIHQGGRITADGYLKQTKDVAALRPSNAEEGRFLLVPSDYLQNSFDTSILFSFALAQFAWRDWRKPRHSKTADELASNFVYQILRKKQYPLVENLAQITLKLKPARRYSQIMLVNWGIACREQGKKEDLHKVLSELEKYKKRRQDVEIAIDILQQRFEQAHAQLRNVAQHGKLRQISPYWPLFNPVRTETWFKNLFYGDLLENERR